MAPRTRRLAAQEEKEKMPKSLRSFFPMEVVSEVLSYVDQSSLASLCRVSFHSLEEAGPFLMKHVDITRWGGFRAFFPRPDLPSSSRLQPHLDVSYLRTLGVRVDFSQYPSTTVADIQADASQRRVFPSAHPLARLTITFPGRDELKHIFDRLLSRLKPQHLELLALSDRRGSSAVGAVGSPLPRSAAALWTSLRRVSCAGWLPVEYYGYLDTPNRPSPSQHPLDLELDVRGWSRDMIRYLPDGLFATPVFSMGTLRSVRWTVDKGRQEATVRALLADSPEDEREKFELVFV